MQLKCNTCHKTKTCKAERYKEIMKIGNLWKLSHMPHVEIRFLKTAITSLPNIGYSLKL